MVFNSLNFLLFFPIVLMVYFLIPPKIRYLWLLIASYYFYMSWNAKYVVLLLFSTVVTYFSGLFIGRLDRSEQLDPVQKTRNKKLCVAVCILLNLSILFLFKYLDMALSILNTVLAPMHLALPNPKFDLILPVGISFYTFQALSYTIDVYRRDVEPEANFLKYALFVSFFPQLVAGPIERSKNLLSQIVMPHFFQYDAMRDGFLLMIWGYFLKVVVADRIAIVVDTVYKYPELFTGCYLIVATILFAVQIYCDFAGYSIIAMGAAEMLGFRLMENFDAPYLADSVADFWRRWHISLSSWFRDYLYIPLGGNRKGKLRKYLNLMIVFATSGLWHGASLHYVVWGCLNGFYQIIGAELMPVRNFIVERLHLHRDSLAHRAYKITFTFLLIAFALLFFRAERLTTAFVIIKNMVSCWNPWILFDGSLYTLGLNRQNFQLMLVCILVLLIADLLKYKKVCVRAVILKQDFWFRCAVVVVSVTLILLLGIWGGGYDASTFIYFQF